MRFLLSCQFIAFTAGVVLTGCEHDGAPSRYQDEKLLFARSKDLASELYIQNVVNGEESDRIDFAVSGTNLPDGFILLKTSDLPNKLTHWDSGKAIVYLSAVVNVRDRLYGGLALDVAKHKSKPKDVSVCVYPVIDVASLSEWCGDDYSGYHGTGNWIAFDENGKILASAHHTRSEEVIDWLMTVFPKE